MENNKTNFFSLPKSKWTKIFGGIILITFSILSGTFYAPVSVEAIGADLVPLGIIGLGIWLIYSGIKQKK
ncbi:MAG: hypothetical protein WAW33_00965 [Minisyncoccia bacterium]|jgi:ABC-type uncharacterized transport system permease subunit